MHCIEYQLNFRFEDGVTNYSDAEMISEALIVPIAKAGGYSENGTNQCMQISNDHPAFVRESSTPVFEQRCKAR